MACADGKLLLAELAGQIERLASGLLAREAQCVVTHLRFDRRAHRITRPEEPIRGRVPFEPLMRALEVVVLDKKRYSSLAVLEVGEHRAREQLLPQRLPEPLDLAAGLRMMWPALDVLDAVALQLRFELG